MEKELPPSTELTPDEYDVRLDGRENIHVFAPDYLVGKCEQFLKTLHIKLKKGSTHKLDNHKNVMNTLDKVSNTGKKEDSLLLLIFWGSSSKNGAFNLDEKEALEFHEIWSKFCNERWRNTPKVFLLNVIEGKHGTQTDSAHMQSEYRTPNEGDILVVFKQNSDLKESEYFIEEFGKMINQYGKREDIASIVTTVQVSNHLRSRPIIISTMTKKLFLIPSDHRGHHYDLYSNNQNILEELTKIRILLASKKHDRESSTGGDMKDMKNKVGEQTDNTEKPRSSVTQMSDQLNSAKTPQRRKSSANKKWLGP